MLSVNSTTPTSPAGHAQRNEAQPQQRQRGGLGDRFLADGQDWYLAEGELGDAVGHIDVELEVGAGELAVKQCAIARFDHVFAGPGDCREVCGQGVEDDRRVVFVVEV